MAYARSCIDGVYEIYTGFGTGAISIAMVEGSALGGGFEAALAHHYVLAQKGVKLGFPRSRSTCSRAWAAIRSSRARPIGVLRSN